MIETGVALYRLFALLLLSLFGLILPSPLYPLRPSPPARLAMANLAKLPGAADSPAPAKVVRGVVADPSGAIVPNAEVDLVDGKGAVAATLHSDGEGNFQLVLPAVGRLHAGGLRGRLRHGEDGGEAGSWLR
jgi:hypothetical protein